MSRTKTNFHRLYKIMHTVINILGRILKCQYPSQYICIKLYIDVALVHNIDKCPYVIV